MATTHSRRALVPAAGHDFALPLYDPLLKLLGFDTLRASAFDRVAIAPGERILDIGCGTGTLAIALTRKHPQAQVTALDPDPKALVRARAKARAAGARVEFVQAFAERIPLGNACIDHVVSSFMFHHLDARAKRATLQEVRRVLVPGGAFHLLDFHDPDVHKGLLTRTLHAVSGALALRGQLERQLEPILQDAGFVVSAFETRRLFIFGALAQYRADVPR